MNRQEILEFVRKYPTSYMATVEDIEPRVRAMQTAHIGEEGLTFCTGVHQGYLQTAGGQSCRRTDVLEP